MKTRHKTHGKTCLLLALFLSTSGIFAQPASWKTHLAEFSPQMGDALIKGWNDSTVVAAYHDNDTQCVALITIKDFLSNLATATVYPAAHVIKLSNELDIKDMCIIGDTLFFCGTHNTLPAYGWYDLSSAFLTPPPYSNIYTITGPIDELYRLVVYKEGSNDYHLVALGRNPVRNFIVESPSLFLNISAVNVALMNSASSTQKDNLDDLTEAEDAIVFVGRDTRYGNNNLCLRLLDKQSPIFTSTKLSNQYVFAMPNHNVQEPILVTGMTNPLHFSIAGICLDINTGIYKLRALDIQVGGSFLPILNSAKEVVHASDKLTDLTSITSNVILALTNLSGTTSTIIPLLFQNSGSYNTPVFSLSGDKLHSIGKLSGNAFASWGSSHSLYLQKYPTTITCTGIDTKTVTPIETDTPSLIHDPLFITTYSITISQLPTSRETWNIFTDCSKKF